jgi:4-hydroxythreonine-4-phosphate dehydrogenase
MTLRLAITPGEPAGIGPDIVIQLVQTPQRADLIAFANAELLQQRADELKIQLKIVPYCPDDQPALLPPGSLRVNSVPLSHHVTAGSPDKKNSSYVIETLNQATDACLNHQCDGLVTGPVNKGLLNAAGFSFSGHTEYLAERTRSDHVVMMLATEGLRVSLVTTHLPLKEVPQAITAKLLEKTLRVLHTDMQRYFCNQAPVIFVCGLNPHAGDQGALGMEEIHTIIPVIKKLREQNMEVYGPFSADTVFSAANMAKADVFLAMYHDQGLPILKYKGFNSAINVTLGLNIVRTSVDHGTAFELAGTSKADYHSLQLAIATAIQMVEMRKASAGSIP